MGDFDPAILLDSEMRRLSVKPNMTARECRLVMAYGAAIESLKATHPQPVTPAGGEVEPVAWVVTCHSDDCEDFAQFVRDAKFVDTLRSHGLVKSVEPLYTHPPAADAALAYRKGWIEAAAWAERDDLVSDIDSPAYLQRRDAALNQRGGGDHG